nr:hypothetical protein CFP56_09712 [Quercus suber]
MSPSLKRHVPTAELIDDAFREISSNLEQHAEAGRVVRQKEACAEGCCGVLISFGLHEESTRAFTDCSYGGSGSEEMLGRTVDERPADDVADGLLAFVLDLVEPDASKRDELDGLHRCRSELSKEEIVLENAVSGNCSRRKCTCLATPYDVPIVFVLNFGLCFFQVALKNFYGNAKKLIHDQRHQAKAYTAVVKPHADPASADDCLF